MTEANPAAIATFLVLTGVGGWIASSTQARVEAPTRADTIHPSQITMNTRDLAPSSLRTYVRVQLIPLHGDCMGNSIPCRTAQEQSGGPFLFLRG